MHNWRQSLSKVCCAPNEGGHTSQLRAPWHLRFWIEPYSPERPRTGQEKTQHLPAGLDRRRIRPAPSPDHRGLTRNSPWPCGGGADDGEWTGRAPGERAPGRSGAPSTAPTTLTSRAPGRTRRAARSAAATRPPRCALSAFDEPAAAFRPLRVRSIIGWGWRRPWRQKEEP